MKPLLPTDVDVRGFRWPLAMVERRRARLLEEAALRLAQVERERSGLLADLDRAEATRGEQIEAVARMLATSIDPGARRYALAFLTGAHARMEVTREALERAEARRDAARLSLQRADRDVQVVGKLRDAAVAELALRTRRRQARHADLEWLARSPAHGGGR